MTEGDGFRIEPRCPAWCARHNRQSNGWADFDHYCDAAGINPGEEGPAFAAWMNALTGWDGDAGPVSDMPSPPGVGRTCPEDDLPCSECPDYCLAIYGDSSENGSSPEGSN